MTKHDDDLAEDRATRALRREPLSPGRVGTYALIGAAAGALPVPWVPDALTRRIRGALAQDVCARHGLSITQEARDVLAEPSGTEGPRGLAAQALRYATRRLLSRVGPFAVLGPVRAGLETLVLGHLLARYLDAHRTERAARVDVEEARRLRRAIDAAMLHALSAEVRPNIEAVPAPPEELRDPLTQMIDGALITAAGLPGWVLRRVETAFDEVFPRTVG